MVEIKNILCAIDFSEMSPRVASYAQTLAEGLNANVYLVYVAPSLDQHASFNVPLPTVQKFVDQIVTEAENKMEIFIKENFKIEDVKGEVLRGYADEEILKFAKREKIDLIIMGTHGRKGVDRIIFGSVAEKVIKSSKIPVLSIRPV